MRRLTTEEFITRAKEIHGNKYDYSKVEYVNSATKVCIICPIHGEFWQNPLKHIKGRGCQKCGGTQKLTTEEFIQKAKKIHDNKYDYSKVEYVDKATKVCIICPIHGEFWQTPDNHINFKQGCPKCYNEKRGQSLKLNTEEFIAKAKEIHDNKYDYSKVKYVNSATKVCIICPIHGEFWQTPCVHLYDKCGCPKCKKDKLKLIHFDTIETFLKKAKEIHGNKYDYSKVKYVNSVTKVCIVCPIHGEFWQTPCVHLRGNGCPYCNESKLEKQISKHFPNLIRQKKFKWLGKQTLDFFSSEKNIAIECQGEQHFKPKKFFGGEEGYEKLVKRDLRKKYLLMENNINLFYVIDDNININNLNQKLYNIKNTIHINDIDKLRELLG